MSFDKLTLRPTYSSEESSLLDDFYIPALSRAISYDRAVGFFSANMLSFAMQGISAFAKRNGRMRLVIGEPLDDLEYAAVKEGRDLRLVHQRIARSVKSVFENAPDSLVLDRLRLLSWLTAAGHLEIKFALTDKGMFHDKLGIMSDEQGRQLVFQGSANETGYGLLPDLNYESIAVYPSWNEPVFEAYARPYIDRFERLWSGQSPRAITIDLPSEAYEIIANFYREKDCPTTDESRLAMLDIGAANTNRRPALPKTLGPSTYGLLPHQRAALNSWRSTDYRGIMALATGAGKTITALHGATALADHHINRGRHFVLIVCVPYQVLADQWCEQMRHFSMLPVRCYRSKTIWQRDLDDALSNLNLATKATFLCIVVVNATLTRPEFQDLVARIDTNDLMLVGDEVHHHASERISKALPPARYRLGLSATPWRYTDQTSKDLLVSSYGPIAATYSLSDALRDNVLTPYSYHPHIVHLTDEETDSYQELSDKIAPLVAQKESGRAIDEDALKFLLLARGRVVGSATGKFEALQTLIPRAVIREHTLIYCGDGSTEDDEDTGTPSRDIERAAKLLDGCGWKSSRFTAQESHAERMRVLSNFQYGYIDAIVAIRVLDEGFDVPACRAAYLLASSRNERQFIQRRGRILRRAPGKEVAEIHDFVVLPSENHHSNAGVALVSSELLRAIEFARHSATFESCKSTIETLARAFSIDIATLNASVDRMEITAI